MKNTVIAILAITNAATVYAALVIFNMSLAIETFYNIETIVEQKANKSHFQHVQKKAESVDFLGTIKFLNEDPEIEKEIDRLQKFSTMSYDEYAEKYHKTWWEKLNK